MRLVLNCLLLCLLALALPLQGMAAVGARACQSDTRSAGLHPASAPFDTGTAPDSGLNRHSHRAHGAADDGALPAAHHHHDNNGHPGVGPDAQTHAPGDSGHPADAHHKCSSCASCCVGAALPVTVALFTPSTGPLALVPTQPAAAPGWLPPQPKRPPRPVAP